MGVTININGLSLIHQNSNGISTATLPNVCHTPGAGPIPYGSVALSRDLVGGTQSVRVDGGFSAATTRSVFATSTGDEAGVLGGIISGVRGAESSFLTYSPDVLIEGSPVGRLTDKMLNNHGNTLNAGGDGNDVTSGKHRKAGVARVVINVRGEGGKPVHAPVTVVLRPVGKGTRYGKVSKKSGGSVVFKAVKMAKYEVIVVHDCYPEAIEDLAVNSKTERKTITLKRRKLRDVAKVRNIRLGVRFTGIKNPSPSEPSHLKGSDDQFDDLVCAFFWESIENEGPLPAFSDELNTKIVHAATEANKLRMGVEVTPLLWIFAFARDTQKWSPNPDWLWEKTGTEPMTLIKSYIAKAIHAFKSKGLIHLVKRWVVINEPMNMLTRPAARVSPFLKALLPTKGNKLTPQAINNLVEILKYTHSLLPRNGSRLLVADYGIESYNGIRPKRFRELMSGIVAGVKNDPDLHKRLRVGLQGHLKSDGDLDNPGAKKQSVAVAAVERQMRFFKDEKLKVCVTECDLPLSTILSTAADGKKKNGYKEHVAKGTMFVPDLDENQVQKVGPDGKPLMKHVKNPNFDANAFFTGKAWNLPYRKACTAQRLDQRDIIAAILKYKNVDAFTWWDFDDDLDVATGSNFRYHGYLFHQHLVCIHCAQQASMRVKDDNNSIYYKKPNYWGTVAAFLHPGDPFARVRT